MDIFSEDIENLTFDQIKSQIVEYLNRLESDYKDMDPKATKVIIKFVVNYNFYYTSSNDFELRLTIKHKSHDYRAVLFCNDGDFLVYNDLDDYTDDVIWGLDYIKSIGITENLIWWIRQIKKKRPDLRSNMLRLSLAIHDK